MVRVSIEGNISSGKSVLVKVLKEVFPDDITVEEPIEEWQNIPVPGTDKIENMLELFYTDISRWAYTFQTIAFITRTKKQMIHLGDDNNKIIYFERSIDTDRKVFAINCYESGSMNDVEWGLYCMWSNWFNRIFNLKMDGIIYIRAMPETCFERLKKRNRDEEGGLGLDYLEQIHHRHEEWLVDGKLNIPVLILDGDIDKFDLDIQKNMLDEIKNFVERLKH